MVDTKKEFIRMPRNVIQLSNEIIRAFDMYWNRGLSEIELKELVWAWASSGKLLEANDINKSVRQRIGKKRTEFVLKLLEGYQTRI